MPRALFKYEDKEFNEERFYYVDSTLFDIFTYKVLKGEVKFALLNPKKIILTEKIANQYFGKSDPIGKTLTSGTDTYEVTGVIENCPTNSHFRFDAVTSRNNLPKQLGVRKVFGANEGIILLLIAKDFLILVSIGIIFAIPVSYYFMNKWLENYVYRSNVGIMVLIMAALLTILITFLTIGFKAYQAAIMNPAKSLKTE